MSQQGALVTVIVVVGMASLCLELVLGLGSLEGKLFFRSGSGLLLNEVHDRELGVGRGLLFDDAKACALAPSLHLVLGVGVLRQVQ